MKTIEYGPEARRKVKEGIDKVANAVKVTLGPKGRNVMLGKIYGDPTITNDGVSIARDIVLKDPLENLGASLIKQVAEKSNDVAGDGTTTSTVITQALAAEGLKYVETGLNPIGIRKGMENAKNAVIEVLKGMSKKISSKKEIAQVATISAESEETGKLIADVMAEIGKDSVVSIEQSNTMGITKEIVKGMSFDRGYISQYFVTNQESLKAEVESPYILITNKRIGAGAEIVEILKKVADQGRKEVVIISDDLEGDALATLVYNKVRGLLNVIAVKAPEYGDNRNQVLEDIAALTGGVVISDEKGMKFEAVELTMLGRAEKVVSTKESTVIIGGKGKKKDIEARIGGLKTLISKADSEFEREKFKKRLAKLAGGVAVLRVGAATETELTYLKHKLEDAVAATRAAVEEGIVVGGGVALYKAALKVKPLYGLMDESMKAGYKTVLKAIQEPIRQIVENTGEESADVVMGEISKSRSDKFGYNALQNRYESDMLKAGIIDPLKVTRTALENAVSVAALLLTTEAVVVEESESSKELL